MCSADKDKQQQHSLRVILRLYWMTGRWGADFQNLRYRKAPTMVPSLVNFTCIQLSQHLQCQFPLLLYMESLYHISYHSQPMVNSAMFSLQD